MATYVIKWHWRPPERKWQIQNYQERTGCQNIGWFHYSENPNWAAQNLGLGHMQPTGRGLDIAALKATIGNNFKKFSLRMSMMKHQQVCK